jgi:hypothetical protein
MIRRPSLALRCWALGLLVLPATGGALAACSNNGSLAAALDSGTSPVDATTDAAPDTSAIDATEEPAEEASCAVDGGPIDDAEAVLGLQLVGQHRCENCHGSTLAGNPDGVRSLTAEGGLAYPPNLTPDPTNGLGCWTDEQIVDAILDGVDKQGMPLCAPMPQFGHLGEAGLDLAQAQDIVEYLRTLPINPHGVPNTPSCPVPPPKEAGAPEAGTDAAADAPASDAGQASDGPSGAEGGD